MEAPVVPLERVVRVRTVEPVSGRVALVRLEPGGPFPFTAGQAVMAGLATSTARRPYSIASAPGLVRRTGLLDLLVGLDEHGQFPGHLAPLSAGSLVALAGPLGTFRLPPRLARRRLLFVAAGTGISPLRAMVGEAVERLPRPEIDLVHSARTPADLAFADEFRTMAGDGRLRYWPTVTREADANWTGRRGRIDGAWLSQALRTPAVCLLCGSGVFCDDMTALLRGLGVRGSSILRERY